MRFAWIRRVAFTSLILTAACGGGPSGPDDASGPITALIDGEPFVAQFATVSDHGGGIIAVNGGGAGLRAVGFQFVSTGVGTYTIAPGNLVAAGVTIGSQAWGAGGDIGAGTITVSTLTANRIAGTFTFTVEASTGQAPATLSVTDGRFDVTF